MNNKFKLFTNKKIETFVSEFKEISKQAFLNEEEKLYHPGEYGIYREKIVKNLLKSYLPTNLEIGTGFIITSNNMISTQCDLIIYDKNSKFIIESEQTFFPVESVVGVIEVKSKLTKASAKEALQKLSRIKELRHNVSSDITYVYKDKKKTPNFDPKINFRDSITTFLICECIEELDVNSLDTYFDDVYKDIDKSLIHNMILSIDDGVLLYKDNNGKLIYTPYFDYANDEFTNICKPKDGERSDILLFISYFHQLITSVSILFFDLIRYIS